MPWFKNINNRLVPQPARMPAASGPVDRRAMRKAFRQAFAALRRRPPAPRRLPSSTPRPRERGAQVVAAAGRDGDGARDDGGGSGDSDGPGSEGGDSDPPPPPSHAPFLGSVRCPYPFLSFDKLAALTGNQLGTHDVACPHCGSQRHAVANRRRRVLRIWHLEPGFITFYCVRCGTGGYAVDGGREPVSRAERIPSSTNCITIFADADSDGVRHAAELQRRLRVRRLFVAIAALEAVR